MERTIGIMIIAIVASITIPIAIQNLIAVDTSGWPAGAVTIWTNLPIFVALFVLVLFAGFLVIRRSRTGSFFGLSPFAGYPLYQVALANMELTALLMASAALVTAVYLTLIKPKAVRQSNRIQALALDR